MKNLWYRRILVLSLAVAVTLVSAEPLPALPFTVGRGPTVQLTQLLKKGLFGDARKVAQQMVKERPDNVLAHSALALIYALNAKTRKECEAEVATLEKLAPQSPYLKISQALMAWQDKKLDTAVTLAQQAVKADESNPLFHTFLGQFYLTKKEVEPAEKACKKAMELEPDLLPPATTMARILLSRKKVEEAHTLLQQYLRKYPNSLEVLRLLGAIYRQIGRTNLAQQVYFRMLNLRPELTSARWALCDLLIQAGNYGQMKAVAETGLKFDPPFYLGHHYLGVFHSRTGDVKAAAAAFKKAVDSGVKLPQTYYMLGCTSLAQGDTKAADRAFDEALKLREGFRPAITGKVVAELKRGSPGSAAKALLAVVDKDKEDQKDLAGNFYLACVAVAQNDARKAATRFKNAIGLLPSFDLVNENFIRTLKPDSAAAVAAATLFNANIWPEAALAEAESVLAKDPRNVLAQYMKVRSLRTNGKWQPALAAAEATVKADPTFLPARVELAQLYGAVRKPDLMLAQQQQILKLKPGAGRVRQALSVALMGKRDYEGTARLAKEGLSLTPPFELGHYFLGEVAARQDKFKEAVKHLEDFEKAAPKSPQAPYLLGVALLARRQRGDTAKALDAFKRSREKSNAYLPGLIAHVILTHATKGNAEPIEELKKRAAEQQGIAKLAHFVLANIYMSEGEKKRAKAAYKESTGFTGGFKVVNAAFVDDMDPRSAVRLNAAVLFLAARWPSQALNQLDALLERYPKNVLGIYMKAKAIQQQEKQEESVALLKKAVNISPKFLPYFTLAEAYRSLKKLDEMNRVYDEAVKLDPENVVLHLYLGNDYYAKGEKEKALRHYRSFLSLRPNNSVALNQVAWILAELNQDLGKALEYAQRAEQLAPRRVVHTVKDTVGFIHLQKGAHAAAVEKFKEALELAPKEPAILYHLGLVYWKMDKKDQAVDMLERALKINPDFADAGKARDLLAKLERD